jgi:enoyl-CoA hydratase/carnithine racemase
MSNNIATITLNRPEKKNAMDLVMRRDLADIVSSIRQDRGIQALIITGAGGAFCAGGDIKTMVEPGGTAEAARERMQDVHVWLEDLLTIDRPVIAAVDGVAYGAGFSLAMIADFILVSPRTRFCMPFLRLGLVPDCGAFYTLPRVVGLQRAKEIIFSTRVIGAEEARQLGIAFEIQPADRLAERARELALSFTQSSTVALSLSKRALNASLNTGLSTVLQMEADAQGIARSTDYHREAVRRFVDKQPALFQWPADKETQRLRPLPPAW